MEWIKCSEELPEWNILVLGFQNRCSFYEEDEPDNPRIFKTAYIDDPKRLISPTFMGITEWDEIDWDVNYEPTHWMPMPNPPGE